MTVQEFMDKHNIKDSFLVFALSVGLRQLNDEEENKEEMMAKFGFKDEETLEQLISELDEISWNK